jgi:hypothetical protein
MFFASVLDSLSDLTSAAFAVAAFGLLFLLLKGLDRV